MPTPGKALVSLELSYREKSILSLYISLCSKGFFVRGRSLYGSIL